MYLKKASYAIIRMGLTPWDEILGSDVLCAIEEEGRKCYKSEDKITETSAYDFVKARMKQGHIALLDSMHITVDFLTDRGISHEWIRHKLTEIVGMGCIEPINDWTPMAVVQESTRYCNYMKNGNVVFIIPPWINIEEGVYNWDEPNLNSAMQQDQPYHNEIEQVYYNNRLSSEHAYFRMLELGLTPQQARDELLIGVKTEFRVTCSLTEWRHVFLQRTSNAAHPQMTEIMRPLYREISARIPIIFDDIKWRI